MLFKQHLGSMAAAGHCSLAASPAKAFASPTKPQALTN